LVALLSLTRFAAADDAVSVPPRTHPGAGQTIYILMPDRFANGRTDNDTGGLTGGPEETGFDPTRTGYYHGGDFAGATAKLDYVRGLGVTAVWTTPPFRNKPVQSGSAGYHGYWVLDFLNVDPHLGTNDEYAEFVRQAHAHGLRVYLDIVVNHTADVIHFADNRTDYRERAAAPYHDAAGRVFDERAAAYNGLNDATDFPALAAERSFPYVPILPPAEAEAKNPAWLNDVTLYHNRGNSSFKGESAVLGDFVGLDDVMTEHPRVVRGFIDVFTTWLDRGVDAFRIDTMRHVNAAFWQAFNPALREQARRRGRPDFVQFGEVMNEAGDVAYLSEFSTGTMAADTTTDFAFAVAARRFLSQGGPAAELAEFFARDDYYTDHDSNVHATVTLLGNYDIGRWGYFLQQDNPGAAPAQLADLARLGHGLMYLVRGMPALHYGDEQGMIGRGGWDQQAREDMFASQTPAYRDAPLLATTRTGKDDKFDPSHPFYRLFAQLGRLRTEHVALRTGAMLVRPTSETACFAFSRIDREERIEYLAAFNRSRTDTLEVAVPTSQANGATLQRLFTSAPDATAIAHTLTADAQGCVTVRVPPLQFAVWRATAPLGPAAPVHLAFVAPAPGAALKFTQREVDGISFPSRVELRADVSGGDGVGEVTFLLRRASRPDQTEYLGTDDAAPYRVFWSPPNDVAVGERLTFTAVHHDLRGHRVSTEVADVEIAAIDGPTGIPGSKTPVITRAPESLRAVPGETVTLTVATEGTAPFEYQWLHDNEPVGDAVAATLTFRATPQSAGTYRVLVRNLAGTAVSAAAEVKLTDR
jgi:glycosidase